MVEFLEIGMHWLCSIVKYEYQSVVKCCVLDESGFKTFVCTWGGRWGDIMKVIKRKVLFILVINRPRVAGAVLQSPLSMIN